MKSLILMSKSSERLELRTIFKDNIFVNVKNVLQRRRFKFFPSIGLIMAWRIKPDIL